MKRTLGSAQLAAIVALVIATIPVAGQTPGARSAVYDVVSIKPAKPDQQGMSLATLPGGRFSMVNGQAAMLIQMAYPSPMNEIVGAPAWVRSDRFDVEARSSSSPTNDDVPLMMRAMLADRFKLAAHYEMKEIPSFSLVLARDDGRLGPQIHRSEIDCAALSAAASKENRVPTMPRRADGSPACGMFRTDGKLVYNSTTMGGLARSLSSAAGRYVVDKTGLMGAYDFTLDYAPRPSRDATSGLAAAPIDDRPDIATALREQLGLKLESDRAEIQFVVIDHIEKPTEN